MAKRVHTPILLQMEPVESGAAALGIVLRYYGSYVPLEELRLACAVSRDGGNPHSLIQAAEYYGLQAEETQPSDFAALRNLPLPQILSWEAGQFVVLEGVGGSIVHINDPASGRRTIRRRQFEAAFGGVAISLKPGGDFQKTGQPFHLMTALRQRLADSRPAFVYLLLVSLFLVVPGVVVPALLRVFVDDILVGGQSWITALLVGMGIAALLRAVLTWLQQRSLLRLEIHVAARASAEFFWHALRLPTTYFTQRDPGDTTARLGLNEDVARLLSGDLALAVINVLMMPDLRAGYAPVQRNADRDRHPDRAAQPVAAALRLAPPRRRQPRAAARAQSPARLADGRLARRRDLQITRYGKRPAGALDGLAQPAGQS